ncbi:hypothetical protein Tco_1095608 [Tanacetum coccineum]
MPTEMELTLEQTQQGVSYEVSVMDTNDVMHRPPLSLKSLNRLLVLFRHKEIYTYFYRLSHSELVDIEKVAVCSSLRSLKQSAH